MFLIVSLQFNSAWLLLLLLFPIKIQSVTYQGKMFYDRKGWSRQITLMKPKEVLGHEKPHDRLDVKSL